jgi:hypothetical protein
MRKKEIKILSGADLAMLESQFAVTTDQWTKDGWEVDDILTTASHHFFFITIVFGKKVYKAPKQGENIY